MYAHPPLEGQAEPGSGEIWAMRLNIVKEGPASRDLRREGGGRMVNATGMGIADPDRQEQGV